MVFSGLSPTLGRTGMVMRKCAPGNWPSTISTVPPCAETNSSTTDKPMPVPFTLAPLGRAAGVERIEDMCALLRRNARTAVRDIHHEILARASRADVNGAALRRIFDRVGQQVLEDQPQLAAVRDQRDVLDLHVEPHALREQRELLVLQHLLDDRAQPELAGLEADAVGLPGAEGQQVLDEPLQLDAVLAQDAGDLALIGVELAHRAIHQQLGAFADIGERRLQFMRHVSQKAVALVREIEQTAAQPFELAGEALQVHRTRHRDGPREGAAAELADGAVQLAQRPAHRKRQAQDGDQRHRQQQGRLPPQPAVRAPGLRLERRDLSIDLRVALLRDLAARALSSLKRRGSSVAIGREPGSGQQTVADRSLQRLASSSRVARGLRPRSCRYELRQRGA